MKRLAAVFFAGVVSLVTLTAAAQAVDGGVAKPAGDAGAKPVTATTGDAGAPTFVVPNSDAGAASTTNVLTKAAEQRKLHPPPPPPNAQQIAALAALKEEVDAYEKGARDYRDTVTSIIKLHYEVKQKEILSGLDSEIAIEKAELKKAREIAIRRLEEFIQTYSGPRAHPEATPDAMYRLAALYEERARSEEATAPLEEGLKDAIRLYKRVIGEYPKYREISAIYYFLGHALNDSGRVPESQQVWRSLVCHNHFPYPVKTDPKDPDKDTITPMPQDADEAHWTQWRRKYNNPKSPSRGNKETVYEEVYPQDCAYVAQFTLRPGEDPKHVPEVWWQIGNWEFDQLDFASGVTKEDPAAVWGYNRAASAYVHSMKYKKPPLFGVSQYKYAWTLFKQQRYELATKEFVNLLLYTDEQEKITGDRGADFRTEAYTYIAGSLTNLDFKGPDDWEPYIMRPDILDTEPNPDKAEQKLHIAIDRAKDPQLIPQDKPWTIEIFRALAYEFRSLNQFKNAVEVYELMLQRWPMDPTAPDTQNAVAETYDQMNITKKPGTPEHDAIAQKALEARTKLANYIGNTPWVDANKDNPAAIQNAERLVRGGLRQAAAQHTTNGRAAVAQAQSSNDPQVQINLLTRAANEYKLAATGWQGYLKQDENAPDAYESRYWNADARHNYVRIQVTLHNASPKNFNEPSKKDIDEALAAAVEVRDSNEDDKYLDNAALFVVDVSDIDRDLAYARFKETGGTVGIEKRDDVKFDGTDESTRKVIKDVIPPVVQQSLNARDEFIHIVPPQLDPMKRGLEYEYYIAETYFLYGQWDEARNRFDKMWKDNCGKNEFGFKAWERLVTIAAKSRNEDEALRLAEAEKQHTCAVSAEQADTAAKTTGPLSQEAAYVKARRKFEEACENKAGSPCKNPEAKEKRPKWKEAGELYEAALAAAPARRDAPEGAMNAAYAYKQIGDYNKAIALYNKFINEYGSNEQLNGLQKGDPKKEIQPNKDLYNERVKNLALAYQTLSDTWISFFNYPKAAETNEKIAEIDRFDEPMRRDAARNAMTLYANIGQRDKMMNEYRVMLKLHPSAEEKANADYLVASFDYKQWDSKGIDSGANRQSRQAGEGALISYVQTNRANAGAAKFVVEAASEVAKMKKVGNEGDYKTWLSQTVAAWDKFKSTGSPDAQKPPYVDYAAEAAFTLIDDEITQKFDVPSKHVYGGSVADVLGDGKPGSKPGKYQNNAAEADKLDKRLEEEVIKKYESLEWVPAAFARQGQIWDTLRSGLYNTVTYTGPNPVPTGKIRLMTVQQEKLLETMRNSGRQDLMDRADALEDAVKDFWKQKKQQELDGADEIMVRRYSTSVAYSRKFNVKNGAVTRAVGRLAYYTDIIGDAKMAQYVGSTPDPTNKGGSKLTYSTNMYVQTRPGLTTLPAAQGGASPLPASP